MADPDASPPASTHWPPRVDYEAAPAMSGGPSIARYDYHPPGLRPANLMARFPSLTARDPASITWPWLRKATPHIWRWDSRAVRQPDTGVQSFEEAELLYNNALTMRGARGLEIGCHYAWSTAHLIAAGIDLDVIDPGLAFPDQRAAVEDSLSRVTEGGPFHLWAGYSPSIVPAVLSTQKAPWSFVFIDGDHDGRAPLSDAEAVAPACAADASVMLHDLVSPHVAAGLRHFERLGWRVGLYNTMQIMGIAWRGAAAPVAHVADPNTPPIDQPHLAGLPVLST